MKHLALLIFLLLSGLAAAQTTAPPKPPVGVPADAKLFNGKWYKVYVEKTTWGKAKQKCERAGGQLAVVPDAPTHVYIMELSRKLMLWLGAKEKEEGIWEWLDGTEMQYKAWARGEPNDAHRLNVLVTWAGAWGDTIGTDAGVVGYICEWKVK